MQHSRSLGSFSSDSTVPSTAPILRKRPQSRSSMDTFLIPGRTRIPSSKPQPSDIQIATALFTSKPALPRRDLPESMTSDEYKNSTNPRLLLSDLGMDGTASPEASERGSRADRKHEEHDSTSGDGASSVYTVKADEEDSSPLLPEVSLPPRPRAIGRDAIIIPNRGRSRKVGDHPPPKRAVPTPPPRKLGPPRKQQQGIYDGAIGSSYESRTTSMTWSTVSHRVLSESSTADILGMGASENLDEFNRLAIQHGLPELEGCPGGSSRIPRLLKSIFVSLLTFIRRLSAKQ